MTNSRQADRNGGQLMRLEEFERPFLDLLDPCGGAVVALVVTAVVKPEVVEASLRHLERLAHLFLG